MNKTNTYEAKENEMTLRSYFDSLPSYERRPFINKMSEACEVSEASAYNWIAGRNKPVKASHYRILAEITGIPQEALFAD